MTKNTTFLVLLVLALSTGAFCAQTTAAQTTTGSITTSPTNPLQEFADYWATMLTRVENGMDPLDVIEHLRSESTLDTPDDLTLCAPIPAGGIPGVTNDRFYFLSEILDGAVPDESPECGHQLACFLSQVSTSPHAFSTLVIDRPCVSTRTQTIPSRFTLAGVGIDGAGQLIFDLPDNGTAIRFPPGPGSVSQTSVIRDLRIVGTSCCGQTGIEIKNSSFVDLERIRVSGFAFGLWSEVSYTANLVQSHFFLNGFNVVLGYDTTAWRIEDTVMSQSGLVGLVFEPTARGHVVYGGRVESNPFAGMLVHGDMNIVERTWFEGNGSLPTVLAVRMNGDQNHLLGNLYSSQLIDDNGLDNTICHSMQFGPSLDNCP
ncbi:MAG: hypothetical protein AAGD38_18835 [Acidobacteriota bacterium]